MREQVGSVLLLMVAVSAASADEVRQPRSVYALKHVSEESLYAGAPILASSYDPNAYEWRIGRAPVQAALPGGSRLACMPRQDDGSRGTTTIEEERLPADAGAREGSGPLAGPGCTCWQGPRGCTTCRRCPGRRGRACCTR